eukprot:6701474-Ditylum_brightwellii.AAC.1
MPEDVAIDLNTQLATWRQGGSDRSLRVLPGHIYVHPSGYKIRLEKNPNTVNYKLVGTAAEGIFTHKPCTVSGGG